MGGEGAAAAAAAAPQSSASAASASGRDSHHQRLPRALCGRVQRGARKRRRRGGALRLSSSAAAAAAALEQRRQDAPEARERHRDALLPSQGRVLPGGDLGAEHQRRIGDGGEREGDESLEKQQHTPCRGSAARSNYLSAYRVDLQFAGKQVRRSMSELSSDLGATSAEGRGLCMFTAARRSRPLICSLIPIGPAV